MLTGAPVVHHLYGIRIRTPWPLPNVPSATVGSWDVEFVEGDAATFAAAARYVPSSQADRWTQSAALPDGSRYCRWTDLFEFLVPLDGRRIQARALKDANLESLQACLLVDALSFSMVRLGREPLHATAVLTDQGAVAFLGRSGYGKSTLGALFVQGGCRLLTDDMLVLTPELDGFLAHAGPPRLKLYRQVMKRIFGDGCHGIAMNPVTEKLIIPMNNEQTTDQPRPLRAIYVISENSADRLNRRPFIRRLSPARALPKVLAAAATHWTYDPDRLKRQFEFVTSLVQSVPVKTLSYPRNTRHMFRVRDAVVADLARCVS